MASRAILSNFFEEQRTQNHPQYLSGLSRARFSTTFLEIAVYNINWKREVEPGILIQIGLQRSEKFLKGIESCERKRN